MNTVGELMTPEEHQSEHARLHRALDELLACWISESRDPRFLNRAVGDLLSWAYEKTLKATPADEHARYSDDRTALDFEGERQIIVLALAELALSRPGWDDAIRNIVRFYDDVDLPTFEAFKRANADRVKAERGSLL